MIYAPEYVGFVNEDEDVEQAKVCANPPPKKDTIRYIGLVDEEDDVQTVQASHSRTG